MPRIIYQHSDGTKDEVDVPEGTSVMRAALANNIPGIVGECGGELMCATCHVYVLTPGALDTGLSEDEDEMLDFAACPRRPESRLSCQIRISARLDGLVVETPEAQN
jgi:2Fe-2S ferredoxin